MLLAVPVVDAGPECAVLLPFLLLMEALVLMLMVVVLILVLVMFVLALVLMLRVLLVLLAGPVLRL